ncbi:TonB-dependent receptor [Gramella sp. AN32]|uniref:TonB-dependent receptor domain-containing protein n=1 Tax=Christiangramia antarctica TaxID=2058158 RepID=A0ABW5XAF4_9FLAO|nr:TonB-dependent receptor [Gramella sp. AN32]MCM4155925.1 TonB-dependent receptor [Gramella sp. AN32]
MKKILVQVILILFVGNLQAQHIRGKVFSKIDEAPIENVLIKIKDSKNFTLTDENGEFQLYDIGFPALLEISTLGYVSVEKKIQSEILDLQIFMQPDFNSLSVIELRGSNIPGTIKKSSYAVSLLTQNDLQKKSQFDFMQNLNEVSGVYVNRGAYNTNKINIRGIGARAQYSTNRIKAYLDGIPLTTAEGELTLDDLDPENLERVEVYKGPVSSSFGAGLGGAINIYTKDLGEEGVSTELRSNFGSFNTSKFGISAAVSKLNKGLRINYNRLNSDGFRANGAYERNSILLNASLANQNENKWNFLFNYIDLKAFIPSSLNEQDFRNNPEKAAFTWNASAGFESYKKIISGISYTTNFSENFKNQTSVFLNYRDGYEPRPFDILDDKSSGLGVRTKFNLEKQFFGLPSKFSFGAEGVLENYTIQNYENLYETVEERRSVEGQLLNDLDQTRNYLNIFGELKSELTEKLILDAGINLNVTAYSIDDRFNSSESDQSGDYTFEPIISPRLGLNYEFSEGKNLYASASHGFSTPTVAETLTPEGLINTNLKTETGFNYEVGLKAEWLNNKLYTELSLYSIQIRNLLVARRIGEDQYIGVNAGKSNHNGMELNTKVYSKLKDVLLTWSLNSNFSFYKFERFVDNGENYSGNEIPGAPEYTISPGVTLNWKNFQGNLNYQAVGSLALDDSNSLYTDAYQLLDLKLNYSWQLSTNLDLDLNFGMDNILNESYAASVVTNAVGFGGSAPRYYYPGLPRNYFGGINLKYQL